MSDTETEIEPIYVSPEARRAISEKVRTWAGWPKGVVEFGLPDPAVSDVAMCDQDTHVITVDPEMVLLNPNRVLLTVTPFRLRQEAVLTGTLLHEAAHARYSNWLYNTEHGDGTPVETRTAAFARLLEEPRVEGRMVAHTTENGAHGLDWTMRAMAAYLIPRTELSHDPAQAVMDLLSSWVLRAGRQIALNKHQKGAYILPAWVAQFTSLLHLGIQSHLTEMQAQGADVLDPHYTAQQITTKLSELVGSDDDTGTTLLDGAREILEMLFPETDDDETNEATAAVSPSAACGGGKPESDSEDGQGGEGDEAGADGEGNTEPEDEGSGEDPGAGDSGSDDAEPDRPDEDDGASASTDPFEDEFDPFKDEEPAPDPSDIAKQIAETLAALEKQSKEQVDDEAEDEAEQTPPLEPGTGAGAGPGGLLGGSWREPTSEQREVQRQAERFLRDLIDTSESSTRVLTDQPSAVIDGVALTQWKAGGQAREPRFFIRTRRNVAPTPPVKIAILVDVSASMDVLQEPSALLSWALSSAALDLRNFAGRGQQVESCLIHWGDSVRTIQKPGDLLPGIRVASCNQGTSNMHGALAEVERLMPGFLDGGSTPVNRLLVQFTDWKLFPDTTSRTKPLISRALASGVNMLSVVPSNFSARYGTLSNIIAAAPVQRGHNSLIKYNPSDPGAVWTQATEMLNAVTTGATPPPFPGF